MNNNKKLYLIDAHNLIYKAYYAFIKRPLYSRSGQPTSAIFGFTQMLIKLLQTENPEYLGISFDPGGKTHRHEIYPEYKATRPPMPQDLVQQVPAIYDIVKSYRINIIERAGVEADDVLAFLAREAVNNNFDVYLLTSDKDAFQLVSDHVFVLSTKKGLSDLVLFDSKKVKEKYGVYPHQIPDYLALIGDTVDNIPGVPSIGPKRAAELLNQFESLNQLYENIELVKNEKMRQKLLENKEQAFLSQQLVTLETNLELPPFEAEKFKVGPVDVEILKSIFQEYDFVELLKELTVGTRREDVQYETVKKLEFFKTFLENARNYPYISLDLETTSQDPMEAEIVGISLSVIDKRGIYVPVAHRGYDKNLVLEEVVSFLAGFLDDRKIKVIGHNIKYDWLILHRNGLKNLPVFFDTMIASHLIDPSKRKHNLDSLAAEFLNLKKIAITDLIGKGKTAKSMADVPVDLATRYACEDADVALRLAKIFKPMLEERELMELFQTIEIPLIKVLVHMEETGVGLDIEYLSKLSREMGDRLEKLQEKIFRLAGQEFNINSPKQLQFILFDKNRFPLKGIRRLKTGYSTDESTLKLLSSIQHPLSSLPDSILEYRTIAKLKSTYVDALPKMVNRSTGRLHTSFNQTITETGRLSSTEPNLQNIPIRTELGKEIRRAFVPRDENHVLLSADYSQIELRILAHMSNDQNMIRAFHEEKDIHTHTAAEVFDVHPDLVIPEMRRKAKMINFGIDYGMTEYGLSSRLGISVKEAKEYIKRYLDRYSGVKRYIEDIKQAARLKGYVTTLCNRRRYINEINDRKKTVRESAERKAINMPVQGTAADMIKIAMIKIHEDLIKKQLKSKMIIQVHDELIFEIPRDELDVMKTRVKTLMENAMQLSVPIVVDICTGTNWAELK